MPAVQIHWRTGRIVAHRVAALAAVLARFPGADDVLVAVAGRKLRLGVTVDAAKRAQLSRAIHDEVDDSVTVVAVP